ncbi:YhfG family protein [Pseudomonas sp. XS1P51]
MNNDQCLKFDMTHIDSLESLKACGGYLSVKRRVEGEGRFKLGVRGWSALYKKIIFMASAVEDKKAFLEALLLEENVSIARKKAETILGVRVLAKSIDELKIGLDLLISFFSKPAITPYEAYENNKRRNFKNSSRLEGVEMPESAPDESLEEILNKYRESA